MTISRVNGSGWGVGTKLTSAQANGLDLNGTYALDKRSGQTDTLASEIACSGAGRVTPTHATGADADTTYYANAANAVIQVTSLTANRAYTFSNTNAVAGDSIRIYTAASLQRTLTIKNSGGTVLCKLGSSPYLDDSFDARGCVLRHNGTDWFVESMSHGRYEVTARIGEAQIGQLGRSVNTVTPSWAAMCWDSKARRFYYAGDTDQVGYSESGGNLLNDDVIPGGVKGTHVMMDIAADDLGNVVATTATQHVYQQPLGGSFAKYATVFAANTYVASVTYDLGNSKFACATMQTAGALLYYSATGTAWTSAGAPPNVPANFGGGTSIGANGSGRVVALFIDNTLGYLHFNYSDDGGVTWSSGSTVTGSATGLDATEVSRKIAYDEQSGSWSCVIGYAGSQSEAYTSTDGVTWSSAFFSGGASDPGMFSVVGIGGAWLVIGRSHDVLISRDNFNSVQYVGTKIGIATGSYDRPSIAIGGSLVMAHSNLTLFSMTRAGRGLTNLI